MQLYASLTSPYARKLRILIHELELADKVAVIETDPMDGASPLPKVNPLGKVPALWVEGEAIYDSPVIAGYLLAIPPHQGLMPAAGALHWRARTIEALADGILDAAVALRIEGTHGEAAGRNPLFPARWRNAIDGGVAALPGALAAMAKHGFGYADICAGVALEYLDFRFPDVPWRERQPALAEHLATFSERPSFVATRPPA